MDDDLDPLDRRRDGARVRLHQRLPRHRERRRDLDLDPGDAAAGRGRAGRDPQLRRRVHLARGRGDDRQRTSSTPTSITPTIVFAGLIGAIAWNLITWYFGLPSSLLARADRRRGRLGVRRRRRSTRCSATGSSRRSLIPARRRARARASSSAALAIVDRLPDRRPAAPGPGDARLPARPDRLGRPARARARHQRRAEDDGHDHARAGRQRQPRAETPTSPTWVVVSAATAIALGTYVGGWRIIRRWARGSSRWTRRRASRPRARARR